MMRSLFAGVAGIRNHQIKMDVIGNNIANVNTIAFKSSRVTFAETFASTFRGATRPTGSLGGINPSQIGLGMGVGFIDSMKPARQIVFDMVDEAITVFEEITGETA